jgi:hypothetical protein
VNSGSNLPEFFFILNMWIKLPNGISVNMNNVTDFYPSNQYKLIKFETLKSSHSIECHFNTQEERDIYLDKLHKQLDAVKPDENIKL